jgi:hypothetical protein
VPDLLPFIRFRLKKRNVPVLQKLPGRLGVAAEAIIDSALFNVHVATGRELLRYPPRRTTQTETRKTVGTSRSSGHSELAVGVAVTKEWHALTVDLRRPPEKKRPKAS